MLTPAGNPVSTIIVMQLEVAGFPVTQGREEVRTQHTISPAVGVYVNMAVPPPTFPPLTFHWYDGVNPPPLGFALKVTEPPAQKGFCEAVIVMLTGTSGLTDT